MRLLKIDSSFSGAVESGKEESRFFIKNQDNYYQPSIVISGISEKKNPNTSGEYEICLTNYNIIDP